MAEQIKTLVQKISEKQADGTFPYGEYTIGASFDNVLSEKDKITLQQFYDNYTSFMKNGFFVYEGTTTPLKKSNVALWIDTSTPNSDTWV